MGPSSSIEETAALLGMTTHFLWVGIQNFRAGAIPAGPLIMLTTLTGMSAVLADIML